MNTLRFSYPETNTAQYHLARKLFTTIASDKDFPLTYSDQQLAQKWQNDLDNHSDKDFYTCLKLVIQRKNITGSTRDHLFAPPKRSKKEHLKLSAKVAPIQLKRAC